LFELIRSGQRKPSQARELYAAAGWTLTFLSWVSIDLGQLDVAGTHLRAARFCAENAEHDLLRAWVAGTRHTAAFWEDDYTTAARHAADGLRLAPRGSGAALFLSSALALDLAKLGDHEKAREVLIRAQEVADELRAPNSDGLGGPFACLTGRAGGFWSDTYFALGEAQDALTLADDAVQTFEKLPAAERNAGSERMVRCQHVKAYLLMQEYDGAREALTPVLTTAPEHRVSPLVRRVSEIGALARGNDAPGLQEVRERAFEFTRQGSQRSIG
jgi:tetratricopeptide (TPR) repeat protein